MDNLKPNSKKISKLKTDYKSRLLVVDAIVGGCTPAPGTMTIKLTRIGLFNNGMWKRGELMKLGVTDLQQIYIANRGKAIIVTKTATETIIGLNKLNPNKEQGN